MSFRELVPAGDDAPSPIDAAIERGADGVEQRYRNAAGEELWARVWVAP